MRALDRREFVLGLSAAVAGLSLANGCRRIETEGLQPNLSQLFGEDDAWRQLGDAYLEQVGTTPQTALEDLARRLEWKPQMSVEELTTAVLRQVQFDFEQGWIGGPDNWGFAETELQIYAVLAAGTPSDPGEGVQTPAR